MKETIVQLFGGWDYFAPLVLATVFGGLVGLERQKHGRPAGVRTHILVCLGSAAVIVAFESLRGAIGAAGQPIIRMDPARAAAGIITGIGFLGAGTILKGKDYVMGLTTAASIWVMAAVGITLGLREYALASAVMVLVLITLYLLDRVGIPTYHRAEVRIESRGGMGMFERARDVLAETGVEVKSFTLENRPADGASVVGFIVRYRREETALRAVDKLSKLEGVGSVSWE